MRRRDPVDMKKPITYILTNKRNGTLYTGVTSNLSQRVYEHRQDVKSGFASKYYCKFLVYFENYQTMQEAIYREKQIKNYPRKRKLALIEKLNPDWQDLYDKYAKF